MKIECEVSEAIVEGQEGVEVECPRCGHIVEAYGRSTRSVARCLVYMREECPKNERNYYVGELE